MSGLCQKQSIFSHSMEVVDSAVKAGYRIGNEIAVASYAFSDGEFDKNCLLRATESWCP